MDTTRPIGNGVTTYMAAALLLLAIVACAPPEARAQWTQPDANNNISNTNSGNVGVGTAAPDRKLQVFIANPNQINVYVASFFRGYTGAVAPGTNYGTGLNFRDYNSIQAGIVALRTDVYNHYFSDLGFYVNGNGPYGSSSLDDNTALVERMRIKSNGNVGIGTASPLAKLHVAGGARLDGAGRVYVGASAAQGARGLEFVEENATTFSIRHHDPNVAWQNIAINPYGGSVGVGTVSPRGRFEVAGGPMFLGDMGNAAWGNMVLRGRVISASNNIHLSPPGGTGVYIDSNYREAGGSAGPVNLHVSGDVVAGGNISAKYQDVAEWVPSVEKLSAGTVVVLDAERPNHVVASTSPYDTRVAGVVSARPGISLGEAGEGKSLVATTGRVKVKADATRSPIRIGDLLVTGERAGVAMKSEPFAVGGRRIHAPGTIIGKALEPLDKGVGEILVLLSLQ